MDIGHQALRLERRQHRRVQPLGQHAHLVLGSARTVADDHHRPAGVADHPGRADQSVLVGPDPPPRQPPGRTLRRGVGRKYLDLVGQHQVSDAAAVDRVLDRQCR